MKNVRRIPRTDIERHTRSSNFEVNVDFRVKLYVVVFIVVVVATIVDGF
jgi:hypothetical protein